MKKSLLSISLSFFLLGSTAFAEDKAELTSVDESVKKSDRQSVFGLSNLGLEAKTYTFPVTYCPLNGNCVLKGAWSVSVDQDYADTVLNTELDMLISQRYDKIIASDSGDITIKTPREDFISKLPPEKVFSFDTGSVKDFDTQVMDYLNNSIGSKVAQVLTASQEERYANMDESQYESFINTQAKEVGLTPILLKQLMNSSYAFALYLPKIEGSITISQVERTLPNGGKTIVYSSSLSAPLNTQLIIYKFNGSEYERYKFVKSNVEGFDIGSMMAKMISGSAGITTPTFPSNADGVKVFQEVFETSFKDSLIALQNRVKKDRNFAISAPLSSADGSDLTANIGCQEDIRADHPLLVWGTDMEGQAVQKGWAKVRTPGDNCILMAEGNRTESQISLISGEAEESDLIVEAPWTGVFAGIQYQNISRSITDNLSKKEIDGAGSMNLVDVYFAGDLGYILNSSALSDVWFNIDLGVGSASGADATFDSGLALEGAIGIEKRFDISSGLFVGVGADLGYFAQGYALKNSDRSLSIGTADIRPEVSLGYQFSPYWQLKGGVGYDLPLMTSSSITDSNDNQVGTQPDLTANAGLSFFFGLDYQVDFAGPFAKMVKRPSSKCEDLKNK